MPEEPAQPEPRSRGRGSPRHTPRPGSSRPSRLSLPCPALRCPALPAAHAGGGPGSDMALRRYLLLLAQEHLEFRLPVSAARPGPGMGPGLRRARGR